MAQQNATTDDVESLTECDEVAAANVSRHPDCDGDYLVIRRDADRFGNVVNGILYDGEHYAFASRRDDCRVETEGGSRLPNWSIKSVGGTIEITDASELAEAYADTNQAEFILDDLERSAHEFVSDALLNRFHDRRDGWDIEALDYGSITLYDANEACTFTVEFEYVEGSR